MKASMLLTWLAQRESKQTLHSLTMTLSSLISISNRTGTSGAQLKEAAEINKSLSLLWRCLNGVKKRGNVNSDPVPFRESKLTHLLMPVLMRTGTSGTSMITCINPKAEDYDETLSILANSSMAHEIREIPKIGRIAGNAGGAPPTIHPFLHQNSSRSSVLTGDKQTRARSNLRDDKAPNSSKKRDASCLSRKFSQESIDTFVSSSSALCNGNGHKEGKASHGSHDSGDGSEDYQLQITFLNERIAELEHENSLIQMEQLEKERLIREDVCHEMAERSGSLLEQIRTLQDELYALKNCHVDPHKSVKKAKRMHEIVVRDLATNDLRETEEEMEVIKFNYEKEIKLLKNEVRNLKAEVNDWRKKAENAMRIIAQGKERGVVAGNGSGEVTPSGASNIHGIGPLVNNENEESNNYHQAIIAETFDERMQRDQRFNKHKKLAELSPKMNPGGPASTVREPLSSVSPNASPVDPSGSNLSSQEPNKFPSKLLNNAALNIRSPPPSPHRSSDALPIAPPQSDIKLNSAPFVPNRVLRSQLRMA